MTRPDGVVDVQPKTVATYTAMCWIGDAADPALLWMAERYGWKILGMSHSPNKGSRLILVGKNNKRYYVRYGDYIIALGANGSLRVATPKEFDRDYREASA